jgi:hypothetical protein
MRKILFLSTIVFLLSIFITPRVPFQDYPDWIYQAKIFKEILKSNPGIISEFSLRPPVVPNSAVTVFMGLMNFLFSPDLSGRILVALDFILIFMALRKIFKIGEVSQTIANSLALLFTPSIFFFYGFLSYNLGLGLYFLIALYPLPSTNRSYSILFYALLFLVLYYIHFIILFMTISTIFAFRVVLKKKNYLKASYLAISLIPIIILYALYLTGPSKELQAQTIWKYNILGKITAYINSMSIFYSFNDFSSNGEMILIMGLNIVFLIGLLYFLYSQVRGRLHNIWRRDYSVIGFAFWIGAFLTPFQIAGFGYKGDRFFWIGSIFLITAILAESKPFSAGKTKFAVALITTIMFGRSVMILFQGYNDYNTENKLSSVIPRKTEFTSFMLKFDYPEYYPNSGTIRSLIEKSCPTIVTVHRIPVYLYLRREQNFKDIFKTGIIKAKPEECNPMAILQDRLVPQNPECHNLLFMSPGGIRDNLTNLAKANFGRVVLEKEFMFVSDPLIIAR